MYIMFNMIFLLGVSCISYAMDTEQSQSSAKKRSVNEMNSLPESATSFLFTQNNVELSSWVSNHLHVRMVNVQADFNREYPTGQNHRQILKKDRLHRVANDMVQRLLCADAGVVQTLGKDVVRDIEFIIEKNRKLKDECDSAIKNNSSAIDENKREVRPSKKQRRDKDS